MSTQKMQHSPIFSSVIPFDKETSNHCGSIMSHQPKTGYSGEEEEEEEDEETLIGTSSL